MIFNYDDYFDEALYLYENDENISGDKSAVSRFLKHKYNIKKSDGAIRKAISERLNSYYADKEIVEQNVKLSKEKQKAQDKNRIANKSFREHARLENALGDFAKAQLEVYKEHGKALKNINLTTLKKNNNTSGVGVMQITDLHGNELVNLPHNKYDFNIMAKRLKLYVSQCIEDFKSKNYEKVAMLFTGDLLNSDRRLDELLNASTNRAKATSLMRYILLQAILEVRNSGFEITIISVLGNESRVGKEMPFSNEGLSDNYDFMIMDGIKQILSFSDIKGISFGSLDKVEEVVEIDGKNWLISHDVSRMTSQQQKAQSGIGRYSLNGVKISFMIGGHIHATNVTDISARSASMVGANSFSENALNLAGKAAQNYYLCKNGRINTVVVDLQDVNNIDGYEIISQLEAYNAKSVSKLTTPITVFKVVI
ncbi:hypothetical protein [uncultured Wocania sp.]|uniref:hypothetical protein n=1 Tax=uncultured Wocania sp. TaxID=2834404 RepID=UPI0030F61591